MFKSSGKWIAVLAIAALSVSGVGIFLALRPSTSAQNATPPTDRGADSASPTGAIAALGRLEPGGETYCVYPPSSSGLSGTIKLWRVREGDRVKQGDVIAVMDTYERLEAAVVQAQAQVGEAESRVAQARQGSKPAEVSAQSAQIAARAEQANAKQAEVVRRRAELKNAQAQLKNAQVELKRAEDLFKVGAVSESQRDSRQTAFESAKAASETAEAALEQTGREVQQAVAEFQQAGQVREGLVQVRDVDVQQAMAQRDVAVANLRKASVDLDTAAVRAPIAGQVLKIHAKEAEQVSSGVGGSNSNECNGVAELGETDRMYAVAEVYETDVVRVRSGQKATISSTAFPNKITGTVERVALRVGKKDVLNTDPAADTDARVVEVRIRLDDSKLVAGLTNLQVKVAIAP